MLNLSDKDLDRLSQEAAQQHEPGEIVGPKFWDKLEARLDRDLGKVNPNPARGIRRLPYYYAPALLVIFAVTYFAVRVNNRSHKVTNSGSPPLTVVRPAPADGLNPTSSQNAVRSDKQNSTPAASSNTVTYPATPGAPPSGTSGASARPTASAGAAGASVSANPANPAKPVITPDNPANPANPVGGSNPSAVRTSPSAVGSTSSAIGSTSSPTTNHAFINNHNAANNNRRAGNHSHRRRPTPGYNATPYSNSSTANAANTNPGGANPATANAANTNAANTNPASANGTRDLTYSTVRGPIRLTGHASVDDSALRAFTLTSLRQPITRRSLHVNNSFTFGILGGPDYASVHSVAGDRAGSTIGLTVDYQFASHLYITSGLLMSRKNYATAPQDYHVPANYYNDIHIGNPNNVEYIKGKFSMLEVPLNLRFDFSTTANTLFYLSAGASSYFFTTENCSYFYNMYSQRTAEKKVTYTNHPDNLFSTLNLSMGVEYGLSNGLSFLVAPYVKVPMRNMGFGQMQLNSFGIDFALRFTPVISRTRR
jgi:hypothetical protein